MIPATCLCCIAQDLCLTPDPLHIKFLSLLPRHAAEENWKIQALPLARIKKIMKSEEFILQELQKEQMLQEGEEDDGERQGVKFMISGEAPVLMSKACELLIKELACRAWQHTERSRRRTLQRQDLHQAVAESEVYDFLIDIVPRVANVNPRTTTIPSVNELPPAQPMPSMGLGLGGVEPTLLNMQAQNMNGVAQDLNQQLQDSQFAAMFQPPVASPADGSAAGSQQQSQQQPSQPQWSEEGL